MFLDDVLSSGAMPTLEATMRFAARRQALIAHNIANLDTPNFIQMDASPAEFQNLLREAVDERRKRTGGQHGDLRWRESDQITRDENGDLTLAPGTPSGNILFHDRNNRDLERLMQAQAENVAVFRVASDLLRSRYQLIQGAIAERVA